MKKSLILGAATLTLAAVTLPLSVAYASENDVSTTISENMLTGVTKITESDSPESTTIFQNVPQQPSLDTENDQQNTTSLPPAQAAAELSQEQRLSLSFLDSLGVTLDQRIVSVEQELDSLLYQQSSGSQNPTLSEDIANIREELLSLLEQKYSYLQSQVDMRLAA